MTDLEPEARHPLLRSLRDLWETKRGARPMPARADFDVLELKDWLGNLMLIEVLEEGRGFRYRLYGSTLASYYGYDLTGKTTDAVAAELRETVHAEYHLAYSERRPIVVEHERAVHHAKKMVTKMILPLSADGIAVNMLLVAVYPD
jgi:hypothetical protein